MSRRRPPLAVLSLCACLTALTACGGGDPGGGATGTNAERPRATPNAIKADPANARTSITVGAKDYTEQHVLGEIYAQAFRAAGYRVDRRLDLADERKAQQELAADEIDGYPEYTGTALASLCGVAAQDIPKDPARAFTDMRSCFRRRGLTAFPPTPFTSSNQVGVNEATAKRLGLRSISDLREHDQDLVLYGTPECARRTDCLRGLRGIYGLRFRRFAGVDPVERYDVLRRRDDAVSIVYSTDARNIRENIVLLDDDRGMFPPYNSTFVVRDAVARAAGPDLPKTIAKVQRGLTDEVMQELNARADIDKQSPAQVARDYLSEAGLVPS